MPRFRTLLVLARRGLWRVDFCDATRLAKFSSRGDHGCGLADAYSMTSLRIAVLRHLRVHPPIDDRSMGTEHFSSRSGQCFPDGRLSCNLERRCRAVLLACGRLYSAHRTSTVAAWGTPLAIGSSGDKPRISSDGLTLYFYDSSLTCASGMCLRKRTRASVGAVWSSATVEMFPDGGGGYQEIDISGDGLQILLSAPISPTTAPVATARRNSLSSAWSAVAPISELNLFSGIRYARWSWDRQQIYFAVTQSGSNSDIYSSQLQ